MMGHMKTLARIAVLSTLLTLTFTTLAGIATGQANDTGCCPNSRLTPLELLQSDHWAYEELRKLWIQGLVDSFYFSSGPVSRYDIARLLISVEKNAGPLPNSPSIERLLREFSREIRELNEEPCYKARTSADPAGDTGHGAVDSEHKQGYRIRDGQSSTKYRETPFLFQKKEQNLDFRLSIYTDATADSWNQDDMDFRDGSRGGVQAWAIIRPNVVLFEDIYIGKMSEGWRYGEELFSLKDVLIFSDRFYVSMRAPFLDVTVGRDKLRWGPGMTGTLLLSDGAPSYTLLSAGKTLGRKLKVSTVSGILDPQEGKYLAGHRIDIAPSNWIQIGLAETAIYHSRFVEPLYAISLIPFTLVERILHRDSRYTGIDDPLRNNLEIGTDFVLRARKGVSFYGELMVDDWAEETSKRPTKLAYQLGTEVSRTAGGRSFNAVAELSRVWNYTYSVSYSEFYDRDDSHQGVPLGYYLGPDSKRIFVQLSCDASRDFELGLRWDELLKGEGTLGQPWREEMGAVDADKLSGVVETRRSVSPFVRWLPRDNFLFEASAGLRQIENENHINKTNRSIGLFSMRIAARW